MRTTSPYFWCKARICLCGVPDHDIKRSGMGDIDHKKGPGTSLSGLK